MSSTNSYFRGMYCARTRLLHASERPAGYEKSGMEQEGERKRANEGKSVVDDDATKPTTDSPLFSWTGPQGGFHARGSSCMVVGSLIRGFGSAYESLPRCKRSYRIEFTNCVLLYGKSDLRDGNNRIFLTLPLFLVLPLSLAQLQIVLERRTPSSRRSVARAKHLLGIPKGLTSRRPHK